VKIRGVFYILFILSFVACNKTTTSKKFTLHTNTGVQFTNTVGDLPQLNILNYLYFYNGAGTAIADFNNDGLQDIYFTANQSSDKLYLNTGSFTFKDITKQSGITNTSGWTTGVTTVDINHDGFLDIYISKVSGHLDLSGSNLLYINQGTNSGTISFKESSAAYGLNFTGFSTQAAFFDYDLDGDLDLYLLNHSLHPNGNYGKGTSRNKIDSVAGDRLFRNDNDQFIDVTQDAGILSSKIGYGLGLSVGDLNQDGYPDLYIGNDFFENDYLYINQQNGTFIEHNTQKKGLGHTSHFSMGTDIVDINNDALPDILSLDMLPEDLETLKASGTEYAYPIYQNQLRNGYKPQYMQNALQLNQGNGRFSEIAFQSGIAATEWSWSPLVADFDNDGRKDLYITNGIQGATNDMDFVNFISNESIQQRLGNGMSEEDIQLIKELPEKKSNNYFYKNTGNASFKNTTTKWSEPVASFSNGAAYADLDNDGDLDIVTNNVNEKAFILENHSNDTLGANTNYLHIQLQGLDANTFGIGAKLTIYTDDGQQHFENYTTRGYLSSVPPSIFVGLGGHGVVDSLRVIWPSKKHQTLHSVPANQRLFLNETEAHGNYYTHPRVTQKNYLKNTALHTSFIHRDGPTIEFDRDPLVPYASTNLGKTIHTGDINNDHLSDIITLGAKGQSTSLHIQQEDAFISLDLPEHEKDAINEDTDAIIFDANSDGLKDIVIVSGGNEFKKGQPLQPRLYLQGKEGFTKIPRAFEGIQLNASTVTAVDIDNDNDLDLCFTANIVPHAFSQTPKQYILKNNGKGEFEDVTNTYAPHFRDIGNVQDIAWKDIDSNGFIDAVVVGHWMPISVFLNDGKQLVLDTNNKLSNTNGWWNTVLIHDFDLDGDIDIVAGNWGHNTRLTASERQPITVYAADFDSNGTIDPIVTYFDQDTETTIATKDELVKQIPTLNKKFLSYHAFAKANIQDLFTLKKLKGASIKSVYILGTTYFENKNNQFEAKTLPFESQVSSTHDMAVDDFNNDGYPDLLLVGNTYEISTQLGRLDASHGLLLLNDKNGYFVTKNIQDFDIFGAARSIQKLQLKDRLIYAVGRNNNAPVFLKKED
jgi:hypothetical protein